MKQFFRDFNEKLDLTAILYIIFGLVLVVWPSITSTLIHYTFSAVCILYGLLHLYRYYTKLDRGFKHFMNIIIGLISSGVGLFALVQADVVLKLLPFVFGLALIFDFLVNMKQSFDLYNKTNPVWKVTMVLATIKVVLGGAMIYNPFTLEASMIFIGVSLLYDGITNLWIDACFKKEPILIEEVETIVVDEENLSKSDFTEKE